MLIQLPVWCTVYGTITIRVLDLIRIDQSQGGSFASCLKMITGGPPLQKVPCVSLELPIERYSQFGRFTKSAI